MPFTFVGGGNFSMVSIFARSTSIIFYDIRCPKIKWHFSQLSTRFISSHRCKTRFKSRRRTSKEDPKTEVIHEYFNKSFNYVMKYGHHASLKCGWCITQTKRHSPISKSTIRACNSDFFLDLQVLW